MNLSTIIITNNEVKHIKNCLTSLGKFGAGEVILVDNNSADDTVWIVENDFPQVRIIKNRSNRGVAVARNQSLKLANGDYVLFLDADAVLTAGALEHLLEVINQDSRIGIAGPKLIYPDGSLQYSCRQFPTFRDILGRGLGSKSGRQSRYLMRDYDHQTPREVDWVLGACQLIRRKTFEDIGFLDERYFYGYEDVDFCWRARRKEWKVVYVPEAVVVHHYHRRSAGGGIFNPLKWSHFASAMRFLIKKNFS